MIAAADRHPVFVMPENLFTRIGKGVEDCVDGCSLGAGSADMDAAQSQWPANRGMHGQIQEQGSTPL